MRRCSTQSGRGGHHDANEFFTASALNGSPDYCDVRMGAYRRGFDQGQQDQLGEQI